MASTYVVIDVNKSRMNTFVAVLRQAEPEAQFLKFASINECQTALCTVDNINSVKGVFVKLDSNLMQISYLIEHLTAMNPDMYVIVLANEVSLEIMKSLVQFKVSQVLMPPYDVNTLKLKMKQAENFQSLLVKELKTLPVYRKFNSWHEAISQNMHVIYLIGWLAENCDLPAIKNIPKNSTLLVDCNLLDGISSIGVRTWLLWVKEMKAAGISKFIFNNVRSFFINQINVVTGFIPEESSIDSFYIRYYNEETDEEFELPLKRGESFNEKEIVVPNCVKVNDGSAEKIYFLDEQLDKTLAFYKGKIKTSDVIANYNFKRTG